MATNALLERKGHRHALLITKGFKDLLLIGNQSRPRIFDLNIRRPSPLYSEVIEVDERVTLVGYTSDPKSEENAIQWNDDGSSIQRGYRGPGWDGEGNAEGPGDIVRGISGEAVRILKRPGTRFTAFMVLRLLIRFLRPGPSETRPTTIVRHWISLPRDRPCSFLYFPRA